MDSRRALVASTCPQWIMNRNPLEIGGDAYLYHLHRRSSSQEDIRAVCGGSSQNRLEGLSQFVFCFIGVESQ